METKAKTETYGLTAEEIMQHIEAAYKFYRDMYYNEDLTETDRETYAEAAMTIEELLTGLELEGENKAKE